MIKEGFLRIVQHILGKFLFDLPILSSVKMYLLSRIFNIGHGSLISYRSYLVNPHINPDACFRMGHYSSIECDCYLDYSGGLMIGNHVWISEGVFISTHEHEVKSARRKKDQPIHFKGLELGDDAWIGAKAIILPKVYKIGKGAVIGAGAVVTKDVDDYMIVAGNPAKVIGQRL